MKISKNNTIIRSLLISGKEFSRERAFRHGAALSYYTLFSMVPIMVILIAIFGWILGPEEVQTVFFELLSERIGPKTAELWKSGVANVSSMDGGFVLFRILAIGVLLFSSTAMFLSLKNSIHDLWHVPLSTGKFLHSLLDRAVSFALLLILGLIIISVFFAESVLVTSTESIGEYLRITSHTSIIVVQSVVGIMANWIILFVIYYFLPDIKLNKKILWRGSLVVAILFQIGNGVIGWYLHTMDMASNYGVVGSIMLVLAWIFYASQVIFFGAKFMFVFSNESGFKLYYRKAGSFKKKTDY